MHSKLISYLLGELGPEDRAEIERRAAEDPAFADELQRLRECLDNRPTEDPLAPEADPRPLGPPPADRAPSGLAGRAADSVSMLALGLQDCHEDGPPGQSPSGESPAGRCRFSMLDAVVAIGVVAAVGMMLVPALRESRESARRAGCANQLREIGQALRAHAADHGGYFPMPPEGANAGSFTIILADNGYLPRHRLSINVVCPGSPEADQVSEARLRVRIPTFDELADARGRKLDELRKVMSLSFAYRSPYQRGDELLPIRNVNNPRAPLLSDAPILVDGQWLSVNHGCGLNVLFQDGRVQHLVGCREPIGQDHIFVNTAGQPAPPTRTDDTVLMRSADVLRVMPLSDR